MPIAILDTNVYAAYLTGAFPESSMESIQREYVIRQSAVVLSELRRGARTRDARQFVDRLFRVARIVWEPGVADWWEAGRLVREIGDAAHWDRNKRRAFQNDALIALTARRHGATVVTADLSDFRLLQRAVRITVLPAR